MAKSLSAQLDYRSTVRIPAGAGFWRRMFLFAGPAYMVSVGYMDPGNWATDLQGGAKFGYRLIWVLLMSNLMAVLLQTLSARLGIVSGKDLAQACRDWYPRPVAMVLWGLCEVAIIACDLAEVLGSAIGLNLLFGFPLLTGVFITAADVLLLLGIQRIGVRKMEAFILTLVATIGMCFIVEIFLAKPEWGGLVRGFIPTALDGQSLYIAIGIIGATVMPHNLYLHSALAQTRVIAPTDAAKRQACRYNLVDSTVALNAAFFVNAAILVLAAAAFNRTGHTEVGELQEAHRLLSPLLGTTVAGFAFALALLCSGQSSSLTGTLAGQIVMEGFLHIHLPPWIRRLVTRLLAIIPAALVIWIKGDQGVNALLILSQVVLSLQLPFAIVPLIRFTSDHAKLGVFANALWVRILAWISAAIIIGLNASLVWNVVTETIAGAGPGALWPWLTLVPFVVGVCGLLVWLVAEPWLTARRVRAEAHRLPRALPGRVVRYRRIGVALEVGGTDQGVLRHAAAAAIRDRAALVLMHVVEGVSAQVYGEAAGGRETREDREYLDRIAARLRKQGLRVTVALGFGRPVQELPRMVARTGVDLLVGGSHGHRFLGDLVHGSTIEPVRHRLKIPVLVIRRHD